MPRSIAGCVEGVRHFAGRIARAFLDVWMLGVEVGMYLGCRDHGDGEVIDLWL